MSLQLRPHPFISTLCGKVMEHVATGNISESQSKLKWINYILHNTRTKLDVFLKEAFSIDMSVSYGSSLLTDLI